MELLGLYPKKESKKEIALTLTSPDLPPRLRHSVRQVSSNVKKMMGYQYGL